MAEVGRQLMLLMDRSLGEAVLVIQPRPPAVLERRFFADLGAPDLFKSRVRQMPPDAVNIGSAHVNALGRAGVWTATMSEQVFGEGFEGVRAAASPCKEYPARTKAMEQGNVMEPKTPNDFRDAKCLD